ncbi:hypothetical protein, variant 1 [Aphanomyces invadans]|nr:hypothetical protein, variant 1 [Aphanomyces invadans]ETW00942.1 hypothetical protein, variant 1 [Aphanomyces invadans]|eukprot:XP_008869940.1 hypothetical protein, variant 1 [Aphanomyces invadans]
MDFVQYIYNAIQEHDAAIVTRLDRQGRTVLHYAVLRNWDVDDVAWAVSIYPGAVDVQDCDGFSPLTYATLYGRRDESILQIAVPLMRQVQAKATRMMEDRNYEGSKRVFVKASRDFLSGVPHFDQAFVEETAVTLDATTASEQIDAMWIEFLAVWGHFDPPEIVVDLPAKWRVTLGTRVVYTIEVKGEPLTYQWFCDGRPLEGFTTDTLDVTGSAVAEDAGAYFCRLTNWRGSVDSTTSVLIVLDDTVVVDPSTRYYRTLPLHPQDVLFNVNAAVGGVLDVNHVQLFIPPRSFEVWDLFDANLADTRGMDVVIRTELEPVLPPIPSLGDGNQVGGWQVVSPLVVVTPHPLDPFQIPWTLRLPHHAAQIQTTNSDNQEFSSHVTVLQCIKDVDSVQTLHVIPPRQLRVHPTHVDIDLVALGTFVVVQKESRPVRMSVVMFARSDQLTVDTSHVQLVVWSCPTRQDCLDLVMASSLSLDGPDNPLLHVGTFPIVLPASSAAIVNVVSASGDVLLEMMLCGKTPRRHGGVVVPLGDTMPWTSRGIAMACPHLVLCVMNGGSYNVDLVVPLKCHANRPVAGAKVLQHTPNGVDVAWAVKSATCKANPPPYFVVEMAAFSDTFWRRYNAIWWFERANVSVVHRMYKVAHMGAHATQIHIATDVHAASLRIAVCNLDSFGEYSGNVLVTPESVEVDYDDEGDVTSLSEQREKRNEDFVTLNGLSQTWHDSHQHVFDVAAQVYSSPSLFRALYGIPLTRDAIVAMLESKKQSHRAAHEDISLLLVGLDALATAAASTVHFHRSVCMHFCKCLSLAARVTPALDLDHSAAAHGVVRAMHHAVQAMFQLLQTVAAPGWFGRFLVASSMALQSSFVDVLEALVMKCRDHPVFDRDLGHGLLLHWENQRHHGVAAAVMDGDELKQLHAWSVALHARQDQALSLAYFTKSFHADMLDEITQDRVAQAHVDVEKHNTLKTRLIYVSPRPDEVVTNAATVEVRFDGTVVDVDCLRFITVKNASLKVRVNGNVAYDKVTRTAVFVPTVALEARSTFKVKLRADAVTTWYGPTSTTMKHSFTTKPM